MTHIETEAMRAVHEALAPKTNGHAEPSILSNVSKVSKLAGDAINKTGEELANFIEKAGDEVMCLAKEYDAESKDLARKLREMYKDETERLNHFLAKIQELRDAMTDAQVKFLGAEQKEAPAPVVSDGRSGGQVRR